MAGVNDLNQDFDIDLTDIFAKVWQKKIVLVAAAVIVTAITFLVLQFVTPRYQSEARILIRQSDSVLTSQNTNQAGQVLAQLDDPGIASQVQLVQSQNIARSVIKALKLSDLEEFDSSRGSSPVRRVLGLLGLVDDGTRSTVSDRVLEAYFDRLTVFQAERARVIVVQFWSHNPALAAKVANQVTAEYVRLQEGFERGVDAEQLTQIGDELKIRRQNLMDAEAKVAEFRASSDLLIGRDNATLATQELSELSTELTRLRAQQSRAEKQADAVERALRSGSLDSATSVLQSALIQRLRERQVNLNSQVAELSTTLLPAHPRLQRLTSQVDALTDQINREARKIRRSLEEEARISGERVQDLVQKLNILKSEAGRVDADLVALRNLQREATTQRDLLSQFELRYGEAKARQNRGFQAVNAKVFSADASTKPYFPKKGPTLIGAFFGSLVLGIMITLASSIIGSTAARPAYAAPRAAQSNLNEPVDVSSADAPSMVPDIDHLRSTTPAGSSVTTVAVAAQSITMLGRARIVILSPEGDDGSESTVVLARYLAGKGSRVALVDMTGNGVSSHSMLGDQALPGVKDLLAGTAGFSQSIHSDRLSTAHVIPIGLTSQQAAASGGSNLDGILDALQEAYDYLLIDCGSADVAGLSRVSHPSSVNIISVSDTNNQSVYIARDMLIHAGFRAPLLVHTQADERQLMGFEAA